MRLLPGRSGADAEWCKRLTCACSDYVATGDREFVRDVWPAVKAAMEYCMQFVGGAGDGCMVQNEGFPDQTYDTWDARGTSAYCGGIWVAALKYGNGFARWLFQLACLRMLLQGVRETGGCDGGRRCCRVIL